MQDNSPYQQQPDWNQQQNQWNQQPPYQQPADDPEQGHRDKLAVFVLLFIGAILVPQLTNAACNWLEVSYSFFKYVWMFNYLFFFSRSVMLLLFGLRLRDGGMKVTLIIIAVISFVLSVSSFVMYNPLFGPGSGIF